ncbi:MAG: T9SS type A sorting domain-containing protein [Bacteroidota bacterium]
MKNNRSNIQKWIILLLFSISAIAAYSQREGDFKFDDFCVRNGDQIEVDVKVCDFEGISVFQFSLVWDTSQLQYVSLRNINSDLEEYTERNFGRVRNQGYINTGWSDPSSRNINLADSSILFTVTYDVIGTQDTMTEITICRTSCVTPIEVGDNMFNVFRVNISPGKITTKSTIVPVELSFFKGTTSSKAHHLHWQTASEFENLGFEIERSANAKEWKVIDFVKGQGTSLALKDYYYIDESPAEGINYYRLKQIDFSGTYEYSSMLALEYEAAMDKRLLVYPNPVKDVLHYQIGIEHSDIQQIRLLNLNGEFVKDINPNESFVDTSDLPDGLYYLLFIENGSVHKQLIVKQMN